MAGEEGNPADHMINDSIKDFVFDLHDACRRSLMQADVDRLYGSTFAELTGKYFNDAMPWPSAEAIANECSNDDLFLLFYKEMTYRHLCGKASLLTMQVRMDVWANYCTLFDTMLASDGAGNAILLNERWAFEIIQEFVYQFQSIAQARSDLSRRDAEEIALLQAHPEAWAVSTVYSYLRRLSRAANVAQVLQAHRQTGAASGTLDLNAAVSEGSTPSTTHFLLGYFAMFGLSRLECLVGDYHGSLEALSSVVLATDHELYHRVFGCYLNLFYHAGFSYLMMRRYKDAIRTFSAILSNIYRLVKSGSIAHIPGADQSSRMGDRMCALLALLTKLAPGAKIDEAVLQMVRDKHGERLANLDKIDPVQDPQFFREVFEALFERGCPKFIVPSLPNFAEQVNTSQDTARRQVELFLKHATQQSSLAKMRSYLKLYTALPVVKLARFNNVSEDEFRAELAAIKHLMTQVENSPGTPPLDGSLSSALDVHFFVHDGMVNISEADRTQRHETFFMSHIGKCDEIAARVMRI